MEDPNKKNIPETTQVERVIVVNPVSPIISTNPYTYNGTVVQMNLNHLGIM